MGVQRVFSAIGIAIFLVIFLNGIVSTFYAPPESSSYSSCSSTTNCYQLNYSSPEYKDCVQQQNDQRDACISQSLSSMKTYQNVYYLIIAVLALAVLFFGFFFFDKKTISGGFVGAGIILLIFASVFALVSGFTSSLIGGLTGMMTGYASLGGDGSTPILTYLNLIFTLAGLILLMYFSYKKIDLPEIVPNKAVSV